MMPKKFFCCFDLKTGAYVVGILMCCLFSLSAILLLLEILGEPWRDWPFAYAVTVVACVDSIIMLIITIWFLFAVRYGKSSVILIWLAAAALWLAHQLVLAVALLIVGATVMTLIAWIFCLIFVIILLGIEAYFFLCVCSYWTELKNIKANNPPAP